MNNLFSYGFTTGAVDPARVSVPRHVTRSANRIVADVIQSLNKRSKYVNYTDAERFYTALYGASYGIQWAVVELKSKYGKEAPLSTVGGWVRQYKAALTALGRHPNIEEAGFVTESKKPTILGDFEEPIKEFCDALRDTGTPVNGPILSGVIRGVVLAIKPSELSENGGHINPFSVSLRQSLFRRWGWTQRRATSSRTAVDEQRVVEVQAKFVKYLEDLIIKYEIPNELILNWDETSVPMVPTSSYTMHTRGASSVCIAGKDDKRNITATVVCSCIGDMLPLQMIYKGKTDRCHSDTTNYPSYVDRVRCDLGVGREVPALCVFDCHKSNLVHRSFYDVLERENYKYALVPAGFTDELQPLDLSVNKPLKHELRVSFTKWYSDQISAGIAAGTDLADIKVDLRLSRIKNIHAGWVVAAYNKLSSKRDLICKGWEMMGLTGGDEDVKEEKDDGNDDELVRYLRELDGESDSDDDEEEDSDQ